MWRGILVRVGVAAAVAAAAAALAAMGFNELAEAVGRLGPLVGAG
jgi:hypothetical protein